MRRTSIGIDRGGGRDRYDRGDRYNCDRSITNVATATTETALGPGAFCTLVGVKSADQCLEEALSLERAAILSESAGERLKLLRAAERLLLQALEMLSGETALCRRKRRRASG